MSQSIAARRAAILMVRGLGGRNTSYYKFVEDSSEEDVPSTRVLRIEQLEPLGLAIQMYCLYLRCLVCDYDGTGALMQRAWQGLLAAPELRRDVVDAAGKLYEGMLGYKVFRANATPLEMVEERCGALYPVLAEAPELRSYVRVVAQALDLLEDFTIVA